MNPFTEEWLAERNARLRGGETPSKALPQAKGRIPKPEMNSTETAYAQYLELLKRSGEVAWYGFECISFKIGQRCQFNVDFLVLYSDGRLEAHDIKGTKRSKKTGKTSPYAEDDAIVKAKATADKFPIPVFFVWKEKNGSWSRRQM